MLSIIADTMMIATRTNKIDGAVDYYDQHRRVFRNEEKKRQDAKRQMNLALSRGLW